MNFLKNLIRKNKFTAKFLEAYFLSKKFLIPQGYYLSRFLRMPVDKNRNPLPWFTYSSIHFIHEKINGKKLSIFEFGSGNSTLWFAKYAKELISIERKSTYFNMIYGKIEKQPNVTYLLEEDSKIYCEKISEYENKFDIIIIDGGDRIQCAKNSISALKKDGIIIFDNTDKYLYNNSLDFLFKANFKNIDFRGLAPIGHGISQTSIFYRDNNCFNI